MRSLNIAYIDDSEMLLDLVSTILEEWGHETLTFSCPIEAIDQIEKIKTDIDILLVDYSMPEMSGIDFLKRIKKENYFGIDEIALFSSHPEEELKKQIHNKAQDIIDDITFIDKGVGEFKEFYKYVESISHSQL